MTEIFGEVAKGFEPVKAAFERNFTENEEVGAAFALYHKGTKVVDLWGGIADVETGRPWEEDTLQLVFSTTKGVAAICLHLLAQRGDVDLDAPAAEYWPEFKAEGKENVPVRWLTCHRTGLPAFNKRIPLADALDWDKVTTHLAAETPIWEPGTTHGYHAVTYGWLVGEIIRRVTGKTPGKFFADELAGPLGIDFFIGLPESEEARTAKLVQMSTLTADGPSPEVLETLPQEMRDMIEAFTNPDSLTQRALNVCDPIMDFNSREVHAAEIPAANGIGTARGLAKLYASTVGPGIDGTRVLSDATVADATTEQSNGPDKVLLVPTRFGSGFFLPSDFSPLYGERSFGHAGAGGSLALADPDAEIGFAYVMNKMQANLSADPRTAGLIDAVKESLK